MNKVSTSLSETSWHYLDQLMTSNILYRTDYLKWFRIESDIYCMFLGPSYATKCKHEETGNAHKTQLDQRTLPSRKVFLSYFVKNS
jgi:hypothetical protein